MAGNRSTAKQVKKAEAADERRQHVRHPRPVLRVSVAGKEFEAVNWSFGGVLLAGVDAMALAVGGLVKIDALAFGDDDPTAVKVRARVIRAERGQSLAALSFLDLDNQAYGVLDVAVRELRGTRV